MHSSSAARNGTAGTSTSTDTREFNDVVQAIQIVLHTCTSPGDGVVVHTPTYPPFLNSLEAAAADLIPVPAQRTESSATGWSFDYDALDATLTCDSGEGLAALSSAEPDRSCLLGATSCARWPTLADRHDLLIISDEIHADLTYAPLTASPDGAVRARSHGLDSRGVEGVQPGGPALRNRALRFAACAQGRRSAARAPAWRDEPDGRGRGRSSVARWRRMVGCGAGAPRSAAAYCSPTCSPSSCPRSATRRRARPTWRGSIAVRSPFGDDPSAAFLAAGVRLSEGPNFGSEGLGSPV